MIDCRLLRVCCERRRFGLHALVLGIQLGVWGTSALRIPPISGPHSCRPPCLLWRRQCWLFTCSSPLGLVTTFLYRLYHDAINILRLKHLVWINIDRMHSSRPDDKLPKLILIPMVVSGRVIYTVDPEPRVFQNLVLDRFYFFYRWESAPWGELSGAARGLGEFCLSSPPIFYFLKFLRC